MFASALLMLAGLSAVSGVQGSVPRGARYVALGSSYAAGAGIGPPVPSSPARCGRTLNNYAHLLAARLGLDLVDASCGGATTVHVLKPWSTLPAQIDSVTPDTRLVTLTIGGNDVHFVGDLARATCRAAGTPDRTRCGPVTPPSEAEWATLERNLQAIAREVARRAPRARLILVDYLNIIPDGKGCAAVPLDAGQTAQARRTFRRLADVTAGVARSERATLIPAGNLSKGHDACSADPWAVGLSKKTAAWHPTPAGHAAIADALEKALATVR